MSAIDDLAQIQKVRAWYKERVRRHLKQDFKSDMSIPANAARWLIQDVITKKPRRIVEFGAGFSTLVFSRALQALPKTELVSLDHDRKWISFAHACARQRGAPMDRVVPMTTHEFLGGYLEPFDYVLVDHGPSYDARIAGIAPIVAMARRVGCDSIILDDWHKGERRKHLYCRPVTNILKSLNCSVEPVADSSTEKDARSLARVLLSGVTPSKHKYEGSELSYWKRRFKDPSIKAVGRKDLDVATNKAEYAKAQKLLHKLLEEDFKDFSTMSVLDLGFGQGHYTRFFHELGIARYQGVDFVAPPLKEFPPSFTFLKQDIGEPFDLEEKFDLVLGLDVLFHIVRDDRFKEALTNIRKHASKYIYITGLFENSHSTQHVKHRELGSYRELGSFRSLTPWRDTRISRFAV